MVGTVLLLHITDGCFMSHVAGRMNVSTPKCADHSTLLTTSLATLFIFDHVMPGYVDAYESVQQNPFRLQVELLARVALHCRQGTGHVVLVPRFGTNSRWVFVGDSKRFD